MTYPQQDGARDRKPERAAIFVDYDNLYRTLGRIAENGAGRIELISEMIEALQRSLTEDRQAQSAVARAYADFSALEGAGERVQRALYLQGVEPLYVPDARRDQTVELQLTVDAMDLLHHRPDISTFVLLTGRTGYLPLIRMFNRYGRNVLVVGFDEPDSIENIPQLEDGWFFPARDLLSSASLRRVESASGGPARPSEMPSASGVDDPVLIQTLEIIDEYFGQYDEVYLTPLLRKLSELLDERFYDPKNLISDLEEHGAVRLEKRQGFPHDYTVLILEEHHPAVADVLSRASGRRSYDDRYAAQVDYHTNGRLASGDDVPLNEFDDDAYDDSYEDSAGDDAYADSYEDSAGDGAYDDDGFDDDSRGEFDDLDDDGSRTPQPHR